MDGMQIEKIKRKASGKVICENCGWEYEYNKIAKDEIKHCGCGNRIYLITQS